MGTYKFVNADQLDSDLTKVGAAIRAKGETTQLLGFPDEMVSAIEAISTGVELNFDVVAYATEAELLAATPAVNTIGVITTTGLNGWELSPKQPESPVEGMVWIETGTSGDVVFNALKEDEIQIYPLSAKQYISGVWVNIYGYVYQSGSWVEFSSPIYYLFKSGEGAKVDYITDRDDSSSISVGTDAIKFSYSSSTGGFYTIFRSEEKIDLSKYNTLYMKCKPSTVLTNSYYKDWYNSVGFTSKAITSIEPSSSPWTARTKITASSSEKTISVDVSSIITSLYFMIDFAGSMSVFDIWLE